MPSYVPSRFFSSYALQTEFHFFVRTDKEMTFFRTLYRYFFGWYNRKPCLGVLHYDVFPCTFTIYNIYMLEKLHIKRYFFTLNKNLPSVFKIMYSFSILISVIKVFSDKPHPILRIPAARVSYYP